MNIAIWFEAIPSLDQAFCLRFARTLFHFLWQGLAVGVLLFLVTRGANPRSARVRYLINVAGLLVMFACLPITFAFLEPPETQSLSSTIVTGLVTNSSPGSSIGDVSAASVADELGEMERTDVEIPGATSDDAAEVAMTTRLLTALAPHATVAYLLGVSIMLLRLGRGLWSAQRLQRLATPFNEAIVLGLMQAQARRIGMKAVPAVAYCQQIAVPVVVGILKPMILLPSSLASGFTPDQLDAILTHELAHIRRFDLLVNLLQRVVESLLFFHPAAWYVSRQVSMEREHCCDDFVLSSGCPRMLYADALIRMAELCSGLRGSHAATQLATLAATGGSPSQLRQRVMRVLGDHEQPRLSVTRGGVMVIALLIISGLVTPAVLRNWGRGAEPSPSIRETDSVPEAIHGAAGSPGIFFTAEKRLVTVPPDHDMDRAAEEIRRLGGLFASIPLDEPKPRKDVTARVTSLRWSGPTDASLGLLVGLHGLETLTVEDNPVTGNELRDIGQAVGLKQLVYREGPSNRASEPLFNGKEFDEQVLQHLAGLADLEYLQFHGTHPMPHLTEQGMKPLTHLKKLKVLHFPYCDVTNGALEKISECKTLEDLLFSLGKEVTDEGISHLSNLPKLKSLYAQSTNCTDAALAELCELRQMRVLGVQGFKITDEGCSHLRKLPFLERLHLLYTPLSDKALKHLEPIVTLKELDVRETSVTEGGARRLRTKLPDLTIHFGKFPGTTLVAASDAQGADPETNDSSATAGAMDMQARLSNGVEVEIVGVSTSPVSLPSRDERSWWKADGSPLDKPPFEPGRLIVGPDKADGREFAIRVTGATETPSLMVLIPSGSKWSTSSLQRTGDAEGLGVYQLQQVIGPTGEAKEATIRLGVGSDPWIACHFDLDGKPLKEQVLDESLQGLRSSIMILRASSSERGVVLWTNPVSSSSKRGEVKFMAIDKAGKEHHHTGGTSNGEEQSLVFDIPPAEFARFECRLRSYRHWVTFENVSLQAAHESKVIVKVESATQAERAPTALAAEEQPAVASCKPQNGVFFTYTGYMTTVLELKDGHFRYWFESDSKSPDEPKYPLSGEYSTVGDTIALKHDKIFPPQSQWAFRAVNGVITLWRPDALASYKTRKNLDVLDVPFLKKYGAGSIVVFSNKPAEELWKDRGAPSR